MVRVDFKKIYFYLVLFFAFILPLSRAGISLFIFLLPLVWIVEGNFKEKISKIFSNKVLLSLMLFIIYGIISLLWSSNTDVALNILRLNGYFLTLFVIATSFDKNQIERVISAFLSGMFISEIIAYGVFFEIWKFKHASVENPSPFMMHIDYSVFLAFSSILLLYRILSSKYDFKMRVLYFIFFLTVTGNLFLAIGRTGQVAYIIAMIVLMILKYRLKVKSFIYAFLMLAVIFTTAYNFSDTFKNRANMAKSDITNLINGNLNTSWGIRVAYWKVTYGILKKHPFGVGIGDYKDAIKEELLEEKYSFLSNETKKFMSNSHPHNQYLLILIQLGIVGFLLFIYFIYQTFKLKIEDSYFKDISILFLVIFYVSCFAEPLLIKQFTLTLYVVFLGLFLSLSDIEVKNIRSLL